MEIALDTFIVKW